MNIYPSNIYLQKLSRKLIGKRLESKFYNKFFRGISETSSRQDQHILMYVGIGSMYLSPVEVLLYHSLREKGINVEYFIYNTDSPINEVITQERVQQIGKETFWKKSVQDAVVLLRSAKVNFEYIKIKEDFKELFDESTVSLDQLLAFRYEGIDFGQIVEGVMYRYYKSLKFGEDATEIALNFMKVSLSNYLQVKGLCEKKKYSHIIFSHGIYCTWEPIVHYCKKYGIDYICYDRAKTQAHCNFNLNQPSPNWDFSDAWNRLKDYNLTIKEEERVEQYLRERVLQKGDVYSYNFSEKVDDLQSLRRRLGIVPEAKIVTFFTNLIWDAANVSRDIAFDSPLDCIMELIRFCNSNKDIHLLIRTHPAEKVLGTKERYGAIIKQKSGILPTNVTIIEPEDNINSFSILDLSDIGIVNTSTVGLEMAITGKPVILISDTHYRNKGFTFDAQNPIDFLEILEQQLIKPISLPDQIKLARKYFYVMMFDYQHRMPMTFTEGKVFNGYGYSSFTSFKEDKQNPLNRIVSRIVEEPSFQDFIFR